MPAYNLVFPCSEFIHSQESDSIIDQKPISLDVSYTSKKAYDQVINPYTLFENEFCNYLSCAFFNHPFTSSKWEQKAILEIIQASNNDPLFFLKCSKKAFEKAFGRI